ncbi:hypothetical protein C8R44DRAFT_983971 [Mycena epipterygia]|nr:hypothetical protein C8R44DRAFT_983971 [Mycena epipterygia]
MTTPRLSTTTNSTLEGPRREGQDVQPTRDAWTTHTPRYVVDPTQTDAGPRVDALRRGKPWLSSSRIGVDLVLLAVVFRPSHHLFLGADAGCTTPTRHPTPTGSRYPVSATPTRHPAPAWHPTPARHSTPTGTQIHSLADSNPMPTGTPILNLATPIRHPTPTRHPDILFRSSQQGILRPPAPSCILNFAIFNHTRQCDTTLRATTPTRHRNRHSPLTALLLLTRPCC